MRRYARSLDCLVALALLASVLTAPGAGAAPKTKALGTIAGQVFSTDGFAVKGARVTLQTSDGRDPRTTLTNATGRFSFPMLPAGLYDVRAYAQGRSSEWRQNVSVGASGQNTLTLHLGSKKPAPAKTSASLKAPSPAHSK